MLRSLTFRCLFVSAFALSGPVHACAQRPAAPLFPGEEGLHTCTVELPLTYQAKDKERYLQAARFMEDQELIYLQYDKRTKKAGYMRVFVVVDASKGGEPLVYLERAEDRMKVGGLKETFFPKFKPGSQRFYNAECFDKATAADPTMGGILEENAAPTAP